MKWLKKYFFLGLNFNENFQHKVQVYWQAISWALRRKQQLQYAKANLANVIPLVCNRLQERQSANKYTFPSRSFFAVLHTSLGLFSANLHTFSHQHRNYTANWMRQQTVQLMSEQTERYQQQNWTQVLDTTNTHDALLHSFQITQVLIWRVLVVPLVSLYLCLFTADISLLL